MQEALVQKKKKSQTQTQTQTKRSFNEELRIKLKKYTQTEINVLLAWEEIEMERIVAHSSLLKRHHCRDKKDVINQFLLPLKIKIKNTNIKGRTEVQ